MLRKVDFNEDWYIKFVNSSNEKDILVSKIKDLIGEEKKSCLEIGLGISPYFASMLKDKFEDYTIIEKRKIEEKMPVGVKLINEDWEAFDADEKFDAVIASHVIYYFKNKKKAVDKILDFLSKDGKAYFVVNGKSADYGPLKLAFSKMIGGNYVFTYDELMKILKGKRIREYTVPSIINFNRFGELFETLKLSFDAYPEEYEKLKDKIIVYFKDNLKSKKFIIDQKIIEVSK